jgi:hypothetical protein
MTIVTKSAFARACNITPGRVSQYITARQLTAPALVGEGRTQRVDLELGRAQLRLRLDTDQRFLNGLNTRLDDPKPVETADDRLGKEVSEFFEAAIPGLVTALAAKLKVSEAVAYLVAEERFEALMAFRADS